MFQRDSVHTEQNEAMLLKRTGTEWEHMRSAQVCPQRVPETCLSGKSRLSLNLGFLVTVSYVKRNDVPFQI